MTIKLASLKADLNREADGDWVEFPDWGETVRFKVRTFHTPAYRVAQSQLTQKFVRLYGKKPVPPDTVTAAYGELFAKHILLDWEGLDVKYTPEKAAEVLADPAYRELTNAVEWCATKLGTIDVESANAEETGKNSLSGSGMNSHSGQQTTS